MWIHQFFPVVVLILLPTLALAQPTELDEQSRANLSRAEERAMHLTLAVNASASILSALATQRCVGEGLCHEVNPAMKGLIHDRPLTGIVVQAAAIGATNYLLWRAHDAKRHRKWVWITTLGITGFNVWKAVHDFRLYRQQRAR